VGASDCALQMSFTSSYQIYAQPIRLLHDAQYQLAKFKGDGILGPVLAFQSKASQQIFDFDQGHRQCIHVFAGARHARQGGALGRKPCRATLLLAHTETCVACSVFAAPGAEPIPGPWDYQQ